MERRLTAILAADVVGYSRLMGADEAGTLAALKAHRKGLVDGKIAEHHGRVVKLTGDGILVEFPSVVNAVACAAEIQRGMRERNADVPDDRRIEFRIGVHLGDIIVEDNDIYGEGVNVAARIESIAQPGGIAVSASVRDHIGNRLDLVFEDWGERVLKNIDRPVQVYNVLLGATPAQPHAAARGEREALTREKPSVAVLPFDNMSGDPEQEYFSDGITEDIITDLSKISGLHVIARNSVFTYKGKPIDVQEVSRRFGVNTVLEGSVRKAGQRVRISAQLVSGKDGGHLWADRYDRDLTDIFAIQDEITREIVNQLKVKLLPEESKAIAQAPTENIEAYTYYLRGRQFAHICAKSYVLLARRMFAKAAELDPNYARAYAGIAICDSILHVWHYQTDVPFEGIFAMSDKALALDPDLAEAHASRGLLYSTAAIAKKRSPSSSTRSHSPPISTRSTISMPGSSLNRATFVEQPSCSSEPPRSGLMTTGLPCYSWLSIAPWAWMRTGRGRHRWRWSAPNVSSICILRIPALPKRARLRWRISASATVRGSGRPALWQ